MVSMEDETLQRLFATWDEAYRSGNGTIDATLHAKPNMTGTLTGDFTFGEVMRSVIYGLEYDGKVEHLTYNQAMQVMQWMKSHPPQ